MVSYRVWRNLLVAADYSAAQQCETIGREQRETFWGGQHIDMNMSIVSLLLRLNCRGLAADGAADHGC